MGQAAHFIFIISYSYVCTIKRLGSFRKLWVALKRAVGFRRPQQIYLELVYLVTAFVPSLTACLANSPGNRRRTAVCISRLVIVDLLL